VEQPQLYHIEDVAERSGLTKRTIRYWEEMGLLKPPSRTEGGYRLFSDDDLQRLQRIKKLKSLLGFSLAEIRDLVETDDLRLQLRAGMSPTIDAEDRRQTLEQMAELARHQVERIDEKIHQLAEMRDEYQRKLTRIRERVAESARMASTPSAGTE